MTAAGPVAATGPADDPYGTAALRSAVLAAWAASPARFREDANAEEDLARGGYRDRVLVELAQNAADAAARSGERGRLLLRLADDGLVAANTGVPLDRAGVEALSALRASAKRDHDPLSTAGRFGVGFAAVRAVADEVRVASGAGAVGWSLAATRAAVADVPALAGEVARRGDALPVLRLPAPAVATVPDGYATAVFLPLRDGAAEALVRSLLAALGDALLLSLPALSEVVVEADGVRRVLSAEPDGDDVVIRDDDRATRWRRVSARGPLDASLLSDRPVEERARAVWAVTVAVPVDEADRPTPLPEDLPRMLHAPTPTDEPLSLPALVIASVPLEPTRRRSAPGPLRDFVLDRAGDAYAGLVAGLPADRTVLDLVPPALAVEPVDARIGAAALERLSTAPWLLAARSSEGRSGEPPDDPPGDRLRPDTAVTVPAARGASRPAVLAEVVADLVDPAWWGHPALRRLGVAELDLAEVLDVLASRQAAPAWWRGLYAALDGADPEALAGLPVPLADGRVVRGARGTFLPSNGLPLPPEAARLLGLRLVDPAAAHVLLARLGADEADPGRLLGAPSVVAAVAAAGPDDDLETLAASVLGLVAAGAARAQEHPWLAELPLRDADGEPAPAGELVLPGSAAAQVFDPEAAVPVAADLVSRWGVEVLTRVGVLATFGLLRDADVPLDGTAEHDLDDEASWVDDVRRGLPLDTVPPVLAELAAVRDLDVVRADAWPQALRMLEADPALRAAVVGPAFALVAGRRVAVPTYAGWWIARHARLDARPPNTLRAADSDQALAGLYDAVELPGVSAALLAAVGVRTALGPELAADLVARLADPEHEVSAVSLVRLLVAVAGADPEAVPPPEAVRVPDGDRTRVVPASDAVVVDAPYWLQLDLPAPLPLPASAAPAVADLLDLPMASEVVDAAPPPGDHAAVPTSVSGLLPAAPRDYVEHDELLVAGREVDWWVHGGEVHAATLEGLARGLAWVAGRWDARFAVAEVLRDPARGPALAAEELWSPS